MTPINDPSFLPVMDGFGKLDLLAPTLGVDASVAPPRGELLVGWAGRGASAGHSHAERGNEEI